MDDNATLLLIEDDERIRDMYATAFMSAGLKVYTARNGEEGIALALEHHPKVILVDIMMPGMNGHHVVTTIRKDAWGKTAHIIYLTNMSDPENVVAAHAQEPEEYIIKAQTDIQDVIKTVRTAMYAK